MYVGATAVDPLQATLSALSIALITVESWQDDDAPVILRIGNSAALAAVAGTWEAPRAASRLMSKLLRLLRDTRGRRSYVWLASYDPLGPYPWGERVSALATYSARAGAWGALPPAFSHVVPRAPATPPWAGDDCPVCLDRYEDDWPSTQRKSRAPPGRWECDHAVCRSCDAMVQAMPRPSCPLCRASRRVFMQP